MGPKSEELSAVIEGRIISLRILSGLFLSSSSEAMAAARKQGNTRTPILLREALIPSLAQSFSAPGTSPQVLA